MEQKPSMTDRLVTKYTNDPPRRLLPVFSDPRFIIVVAPGDLIDWRIDVLNKWRRSGAKILQMNW
jgi:hypothetical protein